MSNKQLPAGKQRARTRLFDLQWRQIWDSATATTPAYQHISTEVNAVIDYSNGIRWSGRFFRTPNGIERAHQYEYLKYMLVQNNPLLEEKP